MMAEPKTDMGQYDPVVDAAHDDWTAVNLTLPQAQDHPAVTKALGEMFDWIDEQGWAEKTDWVQYGAFHDNAAETPFSDYYQFRFPDVKKAVMFKLRWADYV